MAIWPVFTADNRFLHHSSSICTDPDGNEEVSAVMTGATRIRRSSLDLLPDSPGRSIVIPTGIETAVRVWQAHLSRSVETWLSRGEKEVVIGDGAEWIWNLVRTLSGRDPDCRSLPCSPASVEVARQLYPHEDVKQKAWMKVHPERLLDTRENRKIGGRAAVHRHRQSPNGREDLHRGRLLRKKCGAYALSSFAASTCLLARV